MALKDFNLDILLEQISSSSVLDGQLFGGNQTIDDINVLLAKSDATKRLVASLLMLMGERVQLDEEPMTSWVFGEKHIVSFSRILLAVGIYMGRQIGQSESLESMMEGNK